MGLMRDAGAVRFLAKPLAANDNSKNQLYLGGDFSALNIIPHGEVYTDETDKAGSIRDRGKANVQFSWIDENGLYEAKHTKLILYPKYPEVRMSGFLLGCKGAPSKIIAPRMEGRVLFIGITNDGKLLGHAVTADSPLAKELRARQEDFETTGVFFKITETNENGSTRNQLITKLTEIYQKHWIPSCKLGADGIATPYSALNGGGYTLESELGISPNGFGEPDYLGWEIKQYGVNNFTKYTPKSVVTLMTPEPTGGLYKEEGMLEFMSRYGYPDKSGKEDRVNFGGVYSNVRTYHKDTTLKLRMLGYDYEKQNIVDMNGGIALLDPKDNVAALWKFTGIMDHWNRKHAQAAYIPSLMRKPPPEYCYGAKVLLCEKTDFSLFLKAVTDGVVYYDPGIKVENASSEKPKTKKRSQFRIKHKDLSKMYHKTELVHLLD